MLILSHMRFVVAVQQLALYCLYCHSLTNTVREAGKGVVGCLLGWRLVQTQSLIRVCFIAMMSA